MGGSFRRRSRGRAGAQRNTQACTPAPTRAISSIMVGCVAQILPYDVSDSLVTRLSRRLAATAAPHPHHTSIPCTHTQHLAHVIEPTATVCARVWLGCAAARPQRPASPHTEEEGRESTQNVVSPACAGHPKRFISHAQSDSTRTLIVIGSSSLVASQHDRGGTSGGGASDRDNWIRYDHSAPGTHARPPAKEQYVCHHVRLLTTLAPFEPVPATEGGAAQYLKALTAQRGGVGVGVRAPVSRFSRRNSHQSSFSLKG